MEKTENEIQEIRKKENGEYLYRGKQIVYNTKRNQFEFQKIEFNEKSPKIDYYDPRVKNSYKK